MTKYNHVKLINEGIIDLQQDYDITLIGECYELVDIYDNNFLVPVSSVLYFFSMKEDKKLP